MENACWLMSGLSLVWLWVVQSLTRASLDALQKWAALLRYLRSFPIFTVRNGVANDMCLQASVCPQGGGVSASVHGGIPPEDTPRTRPPRDQTLPPGPDTPSLDQTPPREQTPPGADTSGTRHPLDQTLPPDTPSPPKPDTHPLEPDTPHRHLPRPDTPPGTRHLLRETATAADGRHPTGMHSCLKMFSVRLNRVLCKANFLTFSGKPILTALFPKPPAP